MRPATLGKNPKYAVSDPGAEPIPGLLQCWLGPLAEELGIEGLVASLQERANVYKGLTPNGRKALLTYGVNPGYRPVVGGNFFASKQLNAAISEMSPKDRRRAELTMAEKVVETVKEKVLPDLHARTKKGGAELVPAKTMFTVHKHVTDSGGNYCLHFLVEIHNMGRCPDGKIRALDSEPLFKNQKKYAADFDARVAHAFAELGLVLKPGPKGQLEVKGLEGLRRVETPQRKKLLDALRKAGRLITPKTLHYEGHKQHRKRNPNVTVDEAVRRTREWVRAAGVNVRRVVVQAIRKTNELIETKRVEKAIARGLKMIDRIGVPVTRTEIEILIYGEATRLRANPARLAPRLTDVLQNPESHGLFLAGPGRLTTRRIERARLRTDASVASLARRRARKPTHRAVQSLRVGPDSAPAHHIAGLAQFSRRSTRLSEPTPAAGCFVEACRRDGRRVLAAASPANVPQFVKAFDARPEHPDVLAARLGKPTMLKTFLRLRQTRWRSAEHVERLYHAARKPDLVLKRDDVVVLDARHASLHSVAAISRAARKARATVVYIQNPADVPTREQSRVAIRGRRPNDRSH